MCKLGKSEKMSKETKGSHTGNGVFLGSLYMEEKFSYRQYFDRLVNFRFRTKHILRLYIGELTEITW